jgi:SAM-dependent methyltransferase
MRCRSCDSTLSQVVIDLGSAPPSNAYLTEAQLSLPEKRYPLRVLVCEGCWLMQTEDFVGRGDVFDSEYHYFSSTSKRWIEHSKNYAIKIIDELSLNELSLVFEIASNDGYLLQHFHERRVPAVGIEPTISTARIAQEKGLETIVDFFGNQLAQDVKNKRGSADLIIGNNVFAHVPDINDFVSGISILLKLNGVCTLEFPHLMSLLRWNQFDTIYHEHFSYLSVIAIKPLLKRHGLRLYKIEKLQTHGGSLRVYLCKIESEIEEDASVQNVLDEEFEFGLGSLEGFSDLWQSAKRMKADLIHFLSQEREAGRRVVGYGAAAKGNTFLNYAGVKTDLIEFVVDAAEAKQSKFLPGSHIPIYASEKLNESRIDTILVLPWNIAEEILEQYSYLKESGTKFFVAVPKLKQL